MAPAYVSASTPGIVGRPRDWRQEIRLRVKHDQEEAERRFARVDSPTWRSRLDAVKSQMEDSSLKVEMAEHEMRRAVLPFTAALRMSFRHVCTAKLPSCARRYSPWNWNEKRCLRPPNGKMCGSPVERQMAYVLELLAWHIGQAQPGTQRAPLEQISKIVGQRGFGVGAAVAVEQVTQQYLR